MSNQIPPIEVNLRGHSAGSTERVLDRLERQLAAFRKFCGPLADVIPLCELGNCRECGESVSGQMTLRNDRWVFDPWAPCAFPGGMPPYETFLDVPSGVLVLGGNLCPAWPEIPPFKFEISHPPGQREHNEAYAEIGLGYIMANSHNMSLHREESGTLLVGRNLVEEDAAGDEVEVNMPGDNLGDIRSNGLRAVCAADLDLYERRCREHGLLDDIVLGDVARARALSQEGEAVKLRGDRDDCLANLAVRVRPGRYRITHLFHTRMPEGQAYVFGRIDPA